MVWKHDMRHYCQKMVIIVTDFEQTVIYNNITNKFLTDLFVDK